MRNPSFPVSTAAALVLGWLAAPGLQSPATPAQKEQPAAPAATAAQARRAQFLEMFARGYFPGRTGQLMVVPREGDIITRNEPDIQHMHGSPWPYDTAIPMFFVGAAVRSGTYATSAVQQDVAVTVASVLRATMPPTVTGRVLPILRNGAKPPKAVLIVVLDGMRPDYFSRYAREIPTLAGLRKRSAWFTAARVNALPSNTAVGHSTIATGTDPRVHGVTGNNLYDRARKERHNMLAGYDPRDLVAPTLADVWQLQTGGHAIVIAQGSSLPASTALAGHGACQVSGSKVTHSGYDETAGRWRTNAECYTQPATVGTLDVSTYFPPDGLWMGQKISTPSAIRRSGIFPKFEADAFIQAIASQPVGEDAVTDLLLLNYKAADYVGHKHGPSSPEMAAVLADMDRNLARILEAVDKRTSGDYLLAVTADHGMPSEPQGGGTRRHFAPQIVDTLNARFDPDARTLVLYYEPENSQIFVDLERLAALRLTLGDLTAFLTSQPFIFAAYTEDEVRRAAGGLRNR